MHKRTPIGNFIHASWTNMNIRAGKYRHLQTKGKCLDYVNFTINFSQPEFKKWCLAQEKHILNLKRPSIDRIDNNIGYVLSNIQVIELDENIRKDKTIFKNGVGVCRVCRTSKKEEDFVTDRKRINNKTTICIICERVRTREKYNRLYKVGVGR